MPGCLGRGLAFLFIFVCCCTSHQRLRSMQQYWFMCRRYMEATQIILFSFHSSLENNIPLLCSCSTWHHSHPFSLHSVAGFRSKITPENSINVSVLAQVNDSCGCTSTQENNCLYHVIKLLWMIYYSTESAHGFMVTLVTIRVLKSPLSYHISFWSPASIRRQVTGFFK